MPMPGPISRQRRRSLGRPSASRGYHFSGTDTLRPSRSSTMSASSVTRTRFAVAVSVAGLEVDMPRFQQLALVLLHQCRDLLRFVLGEPTVVFQSDRLQPEQVAGIERGDFIACS